MEEHINIILLNYFYTRLTIIEYTIFSVTKDNNIYFRKYNAMHMYRQHSKYLPTYIF